MLNGPLARRGLLALFFLCSAAVVRGQALPEGPIQLFDGKVAVGGEVIATGGNADDIAFFNYTDYEHNALRMIRFGISGVYRPANWLTLVAEVRSEDLEPPNAYAAYVRLHPWRNHAFDIQAGRIPPAFGSFGRRLYETGNPVIGYPLAYQYLTSLRTDAIPATADDVLKMRSRGWRSSFPVGSSEPGPGIPLMSGVPVGHRRRGELAHGARRTGRLGDQRHAVEPARRGRQRRKAVRRARRRDAVDWAGAWSVRGKRRVAV